MAAAAVTGVVSGERRVGAHGEWRVGVHGEEKQRARKEGKARRGRKEGERAALIRSNSAHETGEGNEALSCDAITQGHCHPNPPPISQNDFLCAVGVGGQNDFF